MELIKVSQDATGQSVVSARDLHTFLESSERFSEWCNRMFTYGFIENQDYTSVGKSTLVGNGAKRELQDYALTIDTAKEIAMLQRSEKGKQARQYFIECERKLQAVQKALTPAELILQQAQKLVDIEREQARTNQRLDKLEAEINNVSEDFYSLEGYYGLNKWRWNYNQSEAQETGRKLKALSGVMGYPVNKVHSAQYGQKNAYHKTVLHKYFNDILGK